MALSCTASRTATSVARAQKCRVSVAKVNVMSRRAVCARALLGPDGQPSTGDTASKKKFISREEEPEQYWTSKSEAAGANPLKDPLAIIGILAIFFPFVLLGIAIATGLIDVSVYR